MSRFRCGRNIAARPPAARLAACVILGVVLLSATACAGTRSVWLAHTTDFHAAILGGSKDRATGRPIGGSAVLAAHVAALRASHPDAVLLLDGGDAMQGAALSNLVRGRSVIDVMNAMRYDAMVIGNHEFDWGLDSLRARMSQARFPFLSSNIFDRATGERPGWARPYAIVNRGGLDVAVIGVTTPEAASTTLPETVAPYEFRDPVAIVNALVPRVRAEGAEIVVVLSHEGGEQGRDGEVRGPIAEMAAGYRGVDAVFGGHSHTWVAGRVGGVPVLISASNGRAIGSVRLDYDEEARRVTAADPSLDPAFADSITPDPEVSAVVASYEALLGPLTSRVVATAAEPLSRDGMEKPLGSLVCDVIRGAARVDIAMQNPGGVRADIPAGPVTVGRLYEVMPFDNTIVTMSLTGAQVRRVLEEALAHGRVMQVSGIRYAFDDSLPEGARLTSVTLDSGSALEAAAAYTLATNDFMASGGDNMETLKSIESVNTNRLVRDAMAEWFDAETAAGRAIHPPPPGRIRDGGRR